jgi:hypothetical protein
MAPPDKIRWRTLSLHLNRLKEEILALPGASLPRGNDSDTINAKFALRRPSANFYHNDHQMI